MNIPKAVGAAIAETGAAVYVEALPQGFRAPCFFVREVKHSCVRTVGERFREKAEIVIVYHPKDKQNAREECAEVSNSLFEQLEFVKTDDGLIHGIEKRSEIENGTLSFYVSFEFFTLIGSKTEKMESLNYNSSPIC